MTLQEMIEQKKLEAAAAKRSYNALVGKYNEARGEADALNAKHRLSEDDHRRVDQLRENLASYSVDLAQAEDKMERLEAKVREYEAIKAEDDELYRKQSEIHYLTPQYAPGNSREVSGDGRTVRAATGEERGVFIRTNDRRPATVARAQRVADHPVASEMIARSERQDTAIVGQHGSLGGLVRAMTTSGGSAIVPTVWAADVIDKARNLSAVLLAGAQIVPMDAKVVQIGRLTGDPTAAFRAEGSAITASDPTFDNVTLTSKTMSALVIGSMEWFQDADNAESIVENAIAQAMAGQLDKVALYGGLNVGGVDLTAATNPVGILSNVTTNASSSVLGGATNGTTQTAASFYNELLDTLYTVRDFNESPNAAIWNSKAARMYAKAYDSTYQPLRRPADLDALQWFTSNQIPSYTQGTMTNVATDVFMGDFTQCLIGQRLDVSIQVLTERYADNGQIGIVANWRGDVGLARARAFSVYRAIKGA